ncbi:MAG: AMP-dependent synthetase/ligase [Thermoplasmatota archaeon]
MSAYPTIPQVLADAVAKHGDRLVFSEKKAGKWVGLTFREYGEAVELFARGLAAKWSLAPGDRVALMGPNSSEWIIAEQAILALGCVSVAIYETYTAEQMAFILADSGAKVLVSHREAAWRKLAPLAKEFPELADVVLVESETPTAQIRTSAPPSSEQRIGHSSPPDETRRGGPAPTRSASAREPHFADVTAAGRAHREREPAWFAARWKAVKPGDLATLIYTSGTTGEPKGVMLSHANQTSNSLASSTYLGLKDTDSALSILPLAHSFERTAELTALVAGIRGWFAESREQIADNLREVRPTVLYSVPRLFEKVHKAVVEQVATAPAARQRVFWWAVRQGERDTIFRPIAHALVFKKIHAKVGGRLRMLVSGGAPLSPDIERFFWAIGLPVLQGYGLTESGPTISVNGLHEHAWGSVGKPLPGVEVRIAEDGEVLARGPGIMLGYWNRAADTKETIDAGGWLHTGDIGHLDANGFLFITDRKKELIVKSNGKKVAPAPIERALASGDVIEQAVVVGDNQPYLAALIVPTATVRAREDARARVAAEVERVNATLAAFERVREFALLPMEMTEDSGELTPTLKVKRRVVAQKYAREIGDLYAKLALKKDEM